MIKKLLIAFSIFLLPLMASIESDLKGMLQGKINTITTILNDKNSSKEQKETRIISSIEDIFDFNLMAKLSLGKEWKKLTPKDREDYNRFFVERVKNSYFEKLNSYTNEKIEIQEPKRVKKNRITIPSHVIGKSEPIKVFYKFYMTKEKKWLIYDLEIEGVSIVQTYRTQFAEILANLNFNNLLEKLSKQQIK